MDVLTFIQSKFNPVKISGREARVVCPFHDDHAPGHMYIEITEGLWHCFHSSCLESGNFYTLLRKLGLVRVYDTIEFPRPKVEIKKEKYLPESIISGYYNYTPTQLINKGFLPELLSKFEVGFDAVNYRVIFPIRNEFGRLVGVCGRLALEEVNEPRYKFYVQEFIEQVPGYEFDKSKYLYNIDNVYAKIKYKVSPIILVEGFKACIWMVQQGYWNTVAIMGSTLSDSQLHRLTGLSNEFYLFLDNDNRKGIDRVADKLMKIGKIFVIQGERNQPDEYSRIELDDLMAKKTTYLTFKLNKGRE